MEHDKQFGISTEHAENINIYNWIIIIIITWTLLYRIQIVSYIAIDAYGWTCTFSTIQKRTITY